MLLIHLSDSEGMCCFLGFLAMIFPGRFNFFFLRASRAPCVCVWENDSHILISYSFLRYLCLSSSLGIIPLQCYWPELDDTPVLQLQSCHSKVNSEWSEWTQTWAICLSWGVEPWVELTFCLQGGMEWWFGSTFFFFPMSMFLTMVGRLGNWTAWGRCLGLLDSSWKNSPWQTTVIIVYF